MRWFRPCIALFAALALRGAGIITATPAVPLPGQPVTFLLIANPDAIGEVRWSFGDGTSIAAAKVGVTTYLAPGSYRVRAAYLVAGNGQVPVQQVAQMQIRVADAPGGAFGISLLRLRWEDGGIDASVPQDFSPLVAYLDFKFEGAGILQGQWLVDGIPVGTFTRQIAFASTVTVDSRDLPSLPTTEPGQHYVSLRLLSPPSQFPVPSIRYFVHLGREDAPRVEEVVPPILHAGEEAELQITGRGLTADTRLAFGKDIAIVSPLRLLGPGRAVVKVYLSPGARPGFRQAVAVNARGRGRGPGGLRVIAVRGSQGR